MHVEVCKGLVLLSRHAHAPARDVTSKSSSPEPDSGSVAEDKDSRTGIAFSVAPVFCF